MDEDIAHVVSIVVREPGIRGLHIMDRVGWPRRLWPWLHAHRVLAAARDGGRLRLELRLEGEWLPVRRYFPA